jgi:hypothetical protein
VFVTLLRPGKGAEQDDIEAHAAATPDGLRVEIEDSRGPLVVLLRTDESAVQAVEATLLNRDGEVLSSFASGSR